MFSKMMRVFVCLAVILPVVSMAESSNQFSQNIEIEYFSNELGVDSFGQEADTDGFGVGYQYYLTPVNISRNAPIEQAAFLQRASSVRLGYVDYSSKWFENRASLLDGNGDVAALGYTYANLDSPYVVGVVAILSNSDWQLLDSSFRRYVTNAENDKYSLTLGYFVEKTLLVSVSTTKGDKKWKYSDATLENFDEMVNTVGLKYLILLDDHAAIDFVVDYSKFKSDPDISTEIDKSTTRSGVVSYYFDPKSGLNFGYSATSASKSTETNDTISVAFTHYLNDWASFYLEFSKGNYSDPEANDSRDLVFGVSSKF